MAAHEGAIGEPLPTPVVRAAMAVRLNGIARGGAGASLPVAQALAALLNAGVTPVVARTGSVGASDLMHMAAIAQVLIGTGHAEVGGEILPGAEALARAGLEPVVLEPKDGLALISANGVSIGQAAIVAEHAGRLARVADLVLAASHRGRVRQPVGPRSPPSWPPSPCPASSPRAPRSGRSSTAAGCSRRAFPRRCRTRCRSAWARRSTARSASSSGSSRGRWRSSSTPWTTTRWSTSRRGGCSATATSTRWRSRSRLDALRPAIAHVGQLSDRRMNHLWSSVAGLFMGESVGDLIEQGGGLLRYTGRDAIQRAPAHRGAGDARHRPARPRRRGSRDQRRADGAAERGGPRPAAGRPRDRAADGRDGRWSACPRGVRCRRRSPRRSTPLRRVREPLGRPARAAAVHAAVSAALCGDILEAALAEVAPAP